MHRGWSCADYRLRKAARNLLSEPAIRLLLPDPDQPASAGKYCAARTDCRAKQGLAAGCRRGRCPELSITLGYVIGKDVVLGAGGITRLKQQIDKSTSVPALK